ncbi:hypothetical protein ANN_21283 [Periplaneta americana]|uniref:PiggyBac transposable element-derived protein 4 C-terminal zinc-finger domain-containing protein n=1 Tax=Periplaneta americana TaxID=6978 RepID=A0ABQ8SG10_PERAM|nr:hypothetical protein ANN_21283 [Periplaneta americana]
MSTNRTNRLSLRLDLIKGLILTFRPEVPSPQSAGRPSINPVPKRLLERHYIEKIPSRGKKSKPQKRCTVCSKHGKRKESIYWCPDCGVGLCFKLCFKEFHTKLDF